MFSRNEGWGESPGQSMNRIDLERKERREKQKGTINSKGL